MSNTVSSRLMQDNMLVNYLPKSPPGVSHFNENVSTWVEEKYSWDHISLRGRAVDSMVY